MPLVPGSWVHGQRRRRVPLRVHVQQQDAPARLAQRGGEVDRGSRLADASLLVGHHDDPWTPRWRTRSRRASRCFTGNTRRPLHRGFLGRGVPRRPRRACTSSGQPRPVVAAGRAGPASPVRVRLASRPGTDAAVTARLPRMTSHYPHNGGRGRGAEELRAVMLDAPAGCPERAQRRLGGGQLGLGRGPLQGPHLSARSAQRQGELRQLGNGATARALTTAYCMWPACCSARSPNDRDAPEIELCHNFEQEARPSQRRFEQGDVQVRPQQRPDHAWQSGAGADPRRRHQRLGAAPRRPPHS
jgi:hypothetical protein